MSDHVGKERQDLPPQHPHPPTAVDRERPHQRYKRKADSGDDRHGEQDTCDGQRENDRDQVAEPRARQGDLQADHLLLFVARPLIQRKSYCTVRVSRSNAPDSLPTAGTRAVLLGWREVTAVPHTYFSLVLGPFDSDEAAATLPGQLGLLRTFRDMRRNDVALVYRTETVLESDGQLTPFFSILCVGQKKASLSAIEAESLLDYAAVTLLPAWAIQHSQEAPLPDYQCRTQLVPSTGPTTSLPIKPDWAPLVDILRRRQEPLVVDLTCIYNPEPTVPRNRRTINVPLSNSSGVEATASSFFIAATASSPQIEENGSLGIHLTVHSKDAPDEVLVRTVGGLILGLPVHAVPVRRNVIFPGMPLRAGVIAPPEEIIRAFHPPYGHMEGRGLSGQRPARLPIRFRNDRTDGAIIGSAMYQGARADSRVPISLSAQDRLRHIYVIGKTGSGKTNLLKNLVREDIVNGRGVAVIDPHGSLVDYALTHVGDRLDEVTLLDFSDAEFLPVVNPLVVDVTGSYERTLAIEELLDIVIRRSFNEFTGPVFEDTVRMLLQSVDTEPLRMLGQPSLPVAVDILRSAATRTWLANELESTDPSLAERWNTFNDMMPHNIAENVRWVLAKFSEFGPDGILYPTTGGPDTGLSLSDVFHERKILLVKIPETSVGRRAAEFLGALVFSRLHRAARERLVSDIDPFYVYVDEFQRFVAVEIEDLVAEARKFNLSLTFAHQNLRQLDAFSRFEGSSSPRLREAIFSNVGNIICMRTSGNDVSAFASELNVSESLIRRIHQYGALARCVVGGSEQDPFTLHVDLAEDSPGNDSIRRVVRERMINRGHWRQRDQLIEDVTRMVEEARKLHVPTRKEARQKASFLDSWLSDRSMDTELEDEEVGEATKEDNAVSQQANENEGEVAIP